MTVEHTVSEVPLEGGLTGVALASPDGLVAEFCPAAGMVGCSLTDRGLQVLGLRGGLGHYLDDAKTFGIPLLAPWANRLASPEYTVAGVTADVTGVPGVHLDANGLPIHGLLAASSGWNVRDIVAGPAGAGVTAALQFDESRPEFPGFPFPHEVAVTVRLTGRVLTITTGITPLTDQAVPVAFGWHPYFALPDVPRADWVLHQPFTRRVVLDDRCIPTGALEDVAASEARLGSRTFDDLFTEVVPGTSAWISGGDRRVGITYVAGYPYAVVFAPPDADLVALEPMTAPTDPFAGRFPVTLAVAGETHSAVFAIEVAVDDVGAQS